MICKNRHLWEKMQIIGRFFYKFESRAGTRPAPAISRGGLATGSQDAIGDYSGIPVLRYCVITATSFSKIWENICHNGEKSIILQYICH